ncbi:MAG: SUMF1/EgtB/PvdO family nonheme iron enzyme [Pseudomonadota bacterium]
MSLYNELKRRHVFKVAATYLVVAWMLLQIADVISEPMSLPDWFSRVLLAFLILGFPAALVLAWAFDLKPTPDVPDSDVASDGSAKTSNRASLIALGLVAGVTVGFIGSAGWWTAGADERRAEIQGIEQLDSLIASSEWEEAYRVATELEKTIPDNGKLAERWAKFTYRTTLDSDPGGANVYRRPYRGTENEWELVGQTPLANIRLPFGLSVLRAEREGYTAVHQVVGSNLRLTERLTSDLFESKLVDLAPNVMRLDRLGTLPSGMLRVPGWSTVIDGVSLQFSDFFLDRVEVTNNDYKEFVDAGGYEKRELWTQSIIVESGELSWEDAMERFVDSTGRPGPSTWVAGDYPNGQDSHPVSGISWYEAEAYARFRGRQLPTLHHWRRAYSAGLFMDMLPLSNLSTESTVPVGTSNSISWSGHRDMAGNAREWVFNSVGLRRYALGGAYVDNAYRAADMGFATFPWNREAGNGLRLAVVRDDADSLATAKSSRRERELRDIASEARVSDDVFEAYRINFERSNPPFDAEVQPVGSDRLMRHEQISIEASDASRRFSMHVYLPKNAVPPYHAVVYWPGTIVEDLTSYGDFNFQLDFVIKSGRAVVFPEYYGTFAPSEPTATKEEASIRRRDAAIRGVKDFLRTVDYLETRPDIDAGKIALFGQSGGARYGGILLALDDRYRAAVLYTPPTSPGPSPDTDTAHYLARVRTPVVMIAGEYDPIVPLPEARAMYEAIGTPESKKRFIITKGGHFVPIEVLIRESLAWFDDHLGVPLKR